MYKKKSLRSLALMLLLTLLPLQSQALPNLKIKTLGGLQFWTDVKHKDHWRIQKHIWTGHYRLLNDDNIRYAWGSLAHCRKQLHQRIPAQSCVSEKQTLRIILVHGLGRSHYSMSTLQSKLKKQGIKVSSFEYPSLLANLEENAKALRQLIEEDGRPTLLITHSYGGIITRKACEKGALPQLQNVLMIAPPNQGSHIAESLRKWKLDSFLGKAAKTFHCENEFHCSKLPTPTCPTTIFTGEQATFPLGFLLPENSDGIVLTRNTKLSGANRILLPGSHTFLMNHPCIIKHIKDILAR